MGGEAGDANEDLARLVRAIDDFPKPGIRFRDITTLLLDPWGLAETIGRLARNLPAADLVGAIEARGFLFGAAVARELGLGLVLIRKDGKLPGRTVAVDYALEYGSDRVVMHADALVPGARVLLVDDLVATGGTAMAAARLVEQAGGSVTAARFVIDLPALGGADRLRAAGIPTDALIRYDD